MTDTPTTAKHSMGTVDRDTYRLGVSRYDRVSSMLLALLALVGMAVLIMFVVWLTNRIFLHHTPNPVLAGNIDDPGDPKGDSDDIEPPPPQEEIIEEEIEETLEAVTDAIATRATMMSQRISGDGDGRGGSGDGGRGGTPRHWEIQFLKGNTIKTYARQLDFFNIELGVCRPGNKIEYAYNLAATRPKIRTGPTDKEKRYYLTWRRSNLLEADRDLLRKAGIELGRNQLFKFLTPEVEGMLLGLAQEKEGGRGRKIRMTRFGILPDGSGYRFYVMRQTYR